MRGEASVTEVAYGACNEFVTRIAGHRKSDYPGPVQECLQLRPRIQSFVVHIDHHASHHDATPAARLDSNPMGQYWQLTALRNGDRLGATQKRELKVLLLALVGMRVFSGLAFTSLTEPRRVVIESHRGAVRTRQPCPNSLENTGCCFAHSYLFLQSLYLFVQLLRQEDSLVPWQT